MSESKHQLAAIMFTDIQGYTALMQEDEEQAINIPIIEPQPCFLEIRMRNKKASLITKLP